MSAVPAPPPAAQDSAAPRKWRVATVSLAGCFGCHMSLLDIDERLFDLIERVEFDRSPLTDLKELAPCDLGLVEGGLCNAENVEVLRRFRAHCRILVAVGACAITGGLPALRNHLDVGTLLRATYGERVPDDPELPLPLARVLPVHEVVRIDHALPGCPPPADAFWQLLQDLMAGRAPDLRGGLIRYD
ncbi:MAG: NADP oxidoreductase [Tepidimonas sp.]|uniref:NADH-quinone oxidoreductase subunit B family protein n=1 Tax=Tepidimonas sp. TaxID=2002775 RepID=UPI00298F332B|nr:NADP oxidoreductase [Tepidimonas sp.]MCS6811369.1 NADP oxidoreductase [Tepidimonas sp.]MDW8335425.1 NADP oxidoreductase [Tepidimonas sp.]